MPFFTLFWLCFPVRKRGQTDNPEAFSFFYPTHSFGKNSHAGRGLLGHRTHQNPVRKRRPRRLVAALERRRAAPAAHPPQPPLPLGSAVRPEPGVPNH